MSEDPQGGPVAGAKGTKQKRSRVRSNGDAVEQTRDGDMITEGNGGQGKDCRQSSKGLGHGGHMI